MGTIFVSIILGGIVLMVIKNLISAKKNNKCMGCHTKNECPYSQQSLKLEKNK